MKFNLIMGLKVSRRVFFLDPVEWLYFMAALMCYRLSATGCSMQEVLFFSTFGTVYCVPLIAKVDRTNSRRSVLAALIYMVVQVRGTCLVVGGVGLYGGGVGPAIRNSFIEQIREILLSLG